MRVIEIPTIGDDGVGDALAIARIAHACASDEVTLHFNRCTFLKYNAVSVLGGLMSRVGGRVVADVSTIRSDVRTFLRGVAFPASLGARYQSSTAVPFRCCRRGYAHVQPTTEYLAEHWLRSRCWIRMTPALQGEVLSQTMEIVNNGHEHAEQDVFACGQAFPGLGVTGMALVDFGPGIPERVRAYRRDSSLPAGTAIEWALESGHSTVDRTTGGRIRGSGLEVLRSFVATNRGTMAILSGSGYAEISEHGTQSREIAVPFPGTCIWIKLRHDGYLYGLSSEIEPGFI